MGFNSTPVFILTWWSLTKIGCIPAADFGFLVLLRHRVEAQGTWEHLSSAEYRDSYALGALGDTIYLLGGQMKQKNQYLITNSVERWSLQGGPWHSAAPLPIPLAYHSVVRRKNRLYVLGGRTPQVMD